MKCKRVRISIGFVILAAFLFYLDQDSQLFFQGMLVCALHEMGHVIAICVFGSCIEGLRLSVAGAELVLNESRSLSYGKEIVVAAAGPAASFLLAWMAAKHHRYLFAGMSMTAGVFNILPIWPLDGGRVLLFALYGICEPQRAEQIVKLLSFGLIGILFGLGIYVFLRFGNPTLCITGGWLFFGAIKKVF